jgi:UDP-2-acetamido-2-deoxy-ribo-hexuluronate aminotransferase
MDEVSDVIVRMRDLSIRDSHISAELELVLSRILESGQFIQGEEVVKFESLLSRFVNSPRSISCASASSGLYLAMKSLEMTVSDEVITTPLSWLVTASAIILAGATPVFVDVDDNFNIDPQEVEKAITSKTRAILVVHYYGRVAQIKELQKIADEHHLVLIEDAAQVFGAEIDGQSVGTFGEIGVFSFSPMKVIGGLGDGGAVVTRNHYLADKIEVLRVCGTIDKEFCISPELKHTMDALHAAFLGKIIPYTKMLINRRRQMAMEYQKHLPKEVICPDLGSRFEHTAYDFPVRVSHRDALNNYLNANGVESRIRHPLLVSNQVVHEHSIKFPMVQAERMVAETLCLPIHNNITIHEILFVCKKISDFYNRT